MDFASMVMSPNASLLSIFNPVDLAVRIRMIVCDVITALNRWLVLLPPVVSWGPVYLPVYKS